MGLTVHPVPPGLVAQRPRVLACRQIDQVNAQLASAMGLHGVDHVSLGLLTCDQDDSTYVALDHATKFANVDVVFARSFYAGSKHASGPYSGEILGVLAGKDPEEVREGLWSMKEALREFICFHTFDAENQPSFFAHVITETGRYLAPLAGITPGEPMAYLIAPPMEAIVGVDAALKATGVKLAKWMPPPSETNFAGAFLVGPLYELEASMLAFVEAIRDLAKAPVASAVRPRSQRR
jgi:ethanolamine utilization protein EutL